MARYGDLSATERPRVGIAHTDVVLFFCRMVLVVNGVLQEEVPADSRTLYAVHPVYRESAAQLHSLPAKLVGPVGLLYVQQREMAATLPQDSKCNAS